MPSSGNVDDDVAEVDIAAPPDQVWDLVAEVTDRRDGEKPLVAKVFHAVMPGRGPRPRGGMAQTLARIRAAAEAP